MLLGYGQLAISKDVLATGQATRKSEEMIGMGFKETLKKDLFVITTDVMAPKGTEASKSLASLKDVKGIVHGVNSTDMPGARLRAGSLAMSVKVKELGFDPILQITCRDRNRLSLQSELLSANMLGIKNVLVLRGDGMEKTDQPGAKAVFDLDSPEVLRAARMLEKGLDLGGNPSNGTPSYCLGAALDPGAEDWELESKRAWQKAEEGAEFYQTQPIFNVDDFAKFLKRLGGIKIPILGGVFMLASAKMAWYLNQNVPGVNVPDEVIKIMESGDPVAKSIDLAVRLVSDLKDLCSGVHIMMVTDWHHHIPEILAQAGVRSVVDPTD